MNEQERMAEVASSTNAAHKIPSGFVEDFSGLVVPERLRRPSAEIEITGEVNGALFLKVAQDLSKIERGNGNKDSLDITLASRGGEVDYGFAIFGRIRQFSKQYEAPVTITGYGPVMSMGAYIIQAGDLRRIAENSTLLLHPSTGGMRGSIEGAEFELKQRKVWEAKYAKDLVERIRKGKKKDITEYDILEAMHANGNNGTYFTAEEALEFGLIDEIV